MKMLILAALTSLMIISSCKDNAPVQPSTTGQGSDTTLHLGFSITSFTPTGGPAGTIVTLSGTGFGTDLTADTVTVGGVRVTSFISFSDNIIRFNTPEGAVTGPISLTKNGKTATTLSNFVVTSDPVDQNGLALNAFWPSEGLPGTTVAITGHGFGTDAGRVTVKIGGVQVKGFTEFSPNFMSFRVPDGAVSGPVSVSLNGKTVTSSTAFLVYNDTLRFVSFDPQDGLPGMQVKVSCTGIGEAQPADVVVQFGTRKARVLYVAPWVGVIAEVPDSVVSAPVTVTYKGVTVRSGTDFTVKLSLTSYQPDRGRYGDTVVLTGMFDKDPGAVAVYFGSVQAQVVSATPYRIVVLVPTPAVTAYLKITKGSNSVGSAGVFTVIFPKPRFTSGMIEFTCTTAMRYEKLTSSASAEYHSLKWDTVRFYTLDGLTGCTTCNTIPHGDTVVMCHSKDRTVLLIDSVRHQLRIYSHVYNLTPPLTDYSFDSLETDYIPYTLAPGDSIYIELTGADVLLALKNFGFHRLYHTYYAPDRTSTWEKWDCSGMIEPYDEARLVIKLVP